MKPRNTLNAAETSALLDYLQRRLQETGLVSQPEVAVRLLNLASDPGAGLKDYAEAVKTDVSLAGRLLRLANSAFFAQRQPITSVERACILLGIERLKAVSLGFFLSRSASVGVTSELSRQVWGESLFRACLMSELARSLVPGNTAEAFIVGLMLDAGIPMLVRWLGPPAEAIRRDQALPAAQFQAEYNLLPFTHVDIVTAMAKRWKLPELLARPIEAHHSEPPAGGATEPADQLQRLAYCVGLLRLDPGTEVAAGEKLAKPAGKVLGVPGDSIKDAVHRAAEEHAAMMGVFRDLAWMSDDAAAVADRAHEQLITVLDDAMISQLRRESRIAPETFTIGGQRVDVESIQRGQAVAFLSDGKGRRLLSHSFTPGEHTAQTIMEALGLEQAQGDQSAELERYIQSLAA